MRSMLLLLLLLPLDPCLPFEEGTEMGPSSSSGAWTALAEEFPHYLELAPCSCDLSEGRCDAYCCCDKVRIHGAVVVDVAVALFSSPSCTLFQDCPQHMPTSSSCVSGLPGGTDPGLRPDLNCSDATRPRYGREEHALLCLRDQVSGGQEQDN